MALQLPFLSCVKASYRFAGSEWYKIPSCLLSQGLESYSLVKHLFMCEVHQELARIFECSGHSARLEDPARVW